MSRDIEVKVFLNDEEYLSLKSVCNEDGFSHSGLLRSLLKARIRSHAHDQIMADRSEKESTETPHKQARYGVGQ